MRTLNFRMQWTASTPLNKLVLSLNIRNNANFLCTKEKRLLLQWNMDQKLPKTFSYCLPYIRDSTFSLKNVFVHYSFRSVHFNSFSLTQEGITSLLRSYETALSSKNAASVFQNICDVIWYRKVEIFILITYRSFYKYIYCSHLLV